MKTFKQETTVRGENGEIFPQRADSPTRHLAFAATSGGFQTAARRRIRGATHTSVSSPGSLGPGNLPSLFLSKTKREKLLCRSLGERLPDLRIRQLEGFFGRFQ